MQVCLEMAQFVFTVSTEADMTENELRQAQPFGTVMIQIDDETRPMNEQEYEQWIVLSLTPPSEQLPA